MPDCIFCQIAQGKSPAEIEYEDPEVIAFWDVNPKAPIHILVVPKKHIPSINDLNPENTSIIGKMFLAAVKVADKKNLKDVGFRLVINQGKHSGQIVEHLHLHVLGGKQLGKMVE